LVDEQGNPQSILKKLTSVEENSEGEKTILKQLIEYAYSGVCCMNLRTATIGLIAEAIEKMGVSGATRDRAVRFFIKAAHHSGIALSSRLTSKMRSRGESDSAKTPEDVEESTNGGAPRRRKRRIQPDAPDHRNQSHTGGAAVKTLTLRGAGGELTLSGTFNAFDLDGAERKLVYDIIDLMKQYEAEKL